MTLNRDPESVESPGLRCDRQSDLDRIQAWTSALQQMAEQSACCGGAAISPRFSASPQSTVNPRPSTERHRRRQVVSSERIQLIPEVLLSNPGEPSRLVSILIRAGRIEALLEAGDAISPDWQIIDHARGRYAHPGLIDAHVHLPADNILRLTPLFLDLFLLHGVTTIRETGDVDGTAYRGYEKAVLQGRAAPSLLRSHYFIGRPPFRWKNSLEMRDEASAQGIVDRLVAEGISCIKLYENLRVADIRILQRLAESAGLVCLGHVPSAIGMEAAGLREPQHFFGVVRPDQLPRDHVFDRGHRWGSVDEQRMEKVVAASREQGMYHCPTLGLARNLLRYRKGPHSFDAFKGLLPRFFGDVVWEPRIGLPAYRHLTGSDLDDVEAALVKKHQLVRHLYRDGVKILAGTDSLQPFSVPGYALLAELKELVTAGLSVEEVRRIATVDAAKRFLLTDRGTIAVGQRADILLLREDPQLSLSAFASLEAVWTGGRLQLRSEIQNRVTARVSTLNSGFQGIAAAILSRLALQRAARNFVQ